MKRISRTTAAISLLCAVAFVLAGQAPQPPKDNRKWTPLFNGRNLDGWYPPTAGSWSVENGEIVAHRAGPQDHAGGWLVTKKNYSDFILRLKFKPGARTYNSGILIRDPAHARIGRPAFTGFEVQIAQDDVGKDENPTGSIYDVARSYFVEQGPQEWASYEVQCISDRIVTFMNGKKMAEAHSRRSYYGGVGMQIHGGNDPVDYHFKDIEISELPPAPHPPQLMEEILEGAPGDFETVDVNAVPAAKGAPRDFIFAFSFRLGKGARGSIDLGGYDYRVADGDEENPSASVAGVARALELDYCLNKIYRPGQWNHARVYFSGNHVVTYLNLIRVGEGVGPERGAGPIAFHTATGTVEFRDVKIKRVK